MTNTERIDLNNAEQEGRESFECGVPRERIVYLTVALQEAWLRGWDAEASKVKK